MDLVELKEKYGNNNRTEEHILPDAIRMKDPHHLAGRILRRHMGQPYSLYIHNGLTRILICTGDYRGSDCHMDQVWVIANPGLWEPTNL